MNVSLEQQLSQLKILKVEKGIIAGKFKHLQKDTPDYTQQLELMKNISRQIKTLETAIKDAGLIAKTSESNQVSAPAFAPLDEQRRWGSEFHLTLAEFSTVADWPTFVTENPGALPSHSPAWAEVIQQSFGHKTFLLCARDNSGQLLGGIPFTVFSSPLVGKFAVSMPYLNYGGIVCEYFDICLAVMRKLQEIRADMGLQHIEVRSIYPNLDAAPSTKKSFYAIETA